VLQCGKPTCFLKVGDRVDDAHAIGVPKEMHSAGRVLEKMPVVGVHLPGICTKVARRLTMSLVNASADVDGGRTSKTNAEADSNDNDKGSMPMCITTSPTRHVYVIHRQNSNSTKQTASYVSYHMMHTGRLQLCNATRVMKGQW